MLEEYATIKNIQKILSTPSKTYTLRGLAEHSNTSKNATGKAIKFMLKRKLITKKVIGPTHQYKANLENPLTKQWKILFNLEEINNSGIIEDILKNNKAQSIILYGSMAKGTNDEDSDADILIITEKEDEKGSIEGRVLNREVNTFFTTYKKWKMLSKKDKAFYDSVILNSLVLYGRKPVLQRV